VPQERQIGNQKRANEGTGSRANIYGIGSALNLQYENYQLQHDKSQCGYLGLMLAQVIDGQLGKEKPRRISTYEFEKPSVIRSHFYLFGL
jgi:hypothetical protein